MSFARLMLAIGIVLSLIGCNPIHRRIRSEPLSAGKTRTFAADQATVVSAVREAVVDAGLEIKEARQLNDTTWMIVGDKGLSWSSNGESVRVIVAKTGARASLVRVLTWRKGLTATGDHSPWIFSYIEFKLR